MRDLQNKVVVITGASKGLGEALAYGFAAHGASVSICARNAKAIKNVEEKIHSQGGSVLSMAVDVRIPDDVDRFVSATIEKFGTIDGIINNASILGDRIPVKEYSYSQWRDVIDVNINGVFLVTKAVLPVMVKQRSGSVVNLSSGVGNRGKPNWGAYCVSKFGVEGFSYMLAEEMREYSVRVNVVNPGGLQTEMRRAAYPDEDQTKLKRPEDIVDVFLYLISDMSKHLTGERIDAQEFRIPVSSS